MRDTRTTQILCGLVATGVIGGPLLFLSLPTSERTEMANRASRLARDLYGKSVDTLNYFEVREVHKIVWDQLN